MNSQVLFLVDASLVRSLVDEGVCGQASLHVMERDFTLETFTQGPDTDTSDFTLETFTQGPDTDTSGLI